MRRFPTALLFCFALFAADVGPSNFVPFVPTVIATPGSPQYDLVWSLWRRASRSADSGTKSLDADLHHLQAGLPQPPVNGFAVDPLNSSTVYLATTYAGGMFWKSTDTGQTWVQAASGLPATGAGIDYFTVFPDTITYLYAKVGGSLYKSSNGAQTWIQIGYLPTSSGTLVIAESQRTRMFYIDAASLMVYSSYTEGTSWQPTFPVSSGTFVSPPVICGASVPYFDPSDLYVTVNLPGAGIYPYASLDGAAFVDQTSVGLGPFSQILSASTGPTYALTSPSTACPTLVNPSNGFYRSSNSGQSWQTLGNSGLDHYGATTIDPVLYERSCTEWRRSSPRRRRRRWCSLSTAAIPGPPFRQRSAQLSASPCPCST